MRVVTVVVSRIAVLEYRLMPSAETIAIVLSTTSTLDEAKSLAQLLIRERLAACVQIDGPIISTYRWQDAIETAEEFRLVIKTTISRWPALQERLATEHSYDEPQIVLINVRDSATGYQSWVADQVIPNG